MKDEYNKYELVDDKMKRKRLTSMKKYLLHKGNFF
jgi:hypothetical protein